MNYNFSLGFYTLFQSFRTQSIIGKCTSRHLFPYGGLSRNHLKIRFVLIFGNSTYKVDLATFMSAIWSRAHFSSFGMR